MTTPRSRLIQAHDATAAYYRCELQAESAAGPRDYLQQRGFAFLVSSEIWTTGYAPPGWTALTGHVRSEGFTDQELLDSGLVLTTRRGTIVDRFRDRIMFGIRDPAGELVGFTGRAAPGASTDCPRYLNSPRTLIFDKGLLLFGLAEQAEQLASGSVPVLTEGPLDAAAFTATDHGGVAACGTALTQKQVAVLAAATAGERAVVSFDADAAGLLASTAANARLASHFKIVDALALPNGTDPAQVLQDGGVQALQDALHPTRPLVDHLIDATIQRLTGHVDSAEARLVALRASARLAVLQRDGIAVQAARLARILDLDTQTVTRELTSAVACQYSRVDTARRGALPEPRNHSTHLSPGP